MQAGTLNGAVKNIDEVMSGSIIDYAIAAVAETTLMDVFEYRKTESTNSQNEEEAKPEFEQ